jgi:5'-nucleotidase
VQAIGNHEFDKKVEGLVPFLKAVNFSVLSCNIDAGPEPTMQGLFNKTSIKEVGGRKIGIIGYTTVETPEISYPGRPM